MKRLLLFLVCCGAVSFPAASSAADQSAGGKELYTHKCALCHGGNGNGDGPAKNAFSPPPADFTKPEFWKKNDIDQFIATTIKNGRGAMPAFALSPEEIQAIITYMTQAFSPQDK